MRFSAALLAVAASTAVAAPTPSNIWNGIYDFDLGLEEFYSRLSYYIAQRLEISVAENCSLSNVSFPSSASGLPAPNGTLAFYAIGRGTQNYTCADSTANTKPVAVGALANLYDASCLAGNSPDLLDLTTDLVINYPLPSTPVTAPLPPANLPLLGHHYFTNSTIPTFNLNTIPSKQFGITLTSKKASMNAPSSAVVGQFNQGNGAVPWLFLTTNADATTGGFTEVYRINTAGGNPPDTCDGQQSTLQVQYSAQYLFYV